MVQRRAFFGNYTYGLKLAMFLLAFAGFMACGSKGAKQHKNAYILLFNGTGTSYNDVAAMEAILSDNSLDFATANSGQLNSMSAAQLRKYRLLIMPGGNFIEMGNSLYAATDTNINNAVHNGVNYLGICAGGFLAGSSRYYKGFGLAAGVTFGFYSAANKGIRKAAVAITTPAAPALEQYWEDGPQFTGWGAVAGKYPDGTPAIVQGAAGNGWVILAGVHAEAPDRWRRGMGFATPASVDNAYAATLIRAALNRTVLAHY